MDKSMTFLLTIFLLPVLSHAEVTDISTDNTFPLIIESDMAGSNSALDISYGEGKYLKLNKDKLKDTVEVLENEKTISLSYTYENGSAPCYVNTKLDIHQPSSQTTTDNTCNIDGKNIKVTMKTVLIQNEQDRKALNLNVIGSVGTTF